MRQGVLQVRRVDRAVPGELLEQLGVSLGILLRVALRKHGPDAPSDLPPLLSVELRSLGP
jgi:hypothetical protein